MKPGSLQLPVAEEVDFSVEVKDRYTAKTMILRHINWAGAGSYRCQYNDSSASVSVHIFVYSKYLVQQLKHCKSK